MTTVTNMPFRQQPVRPVPDRQTDLAPRKLADNLLRTYTHTHFSLLYNTHNYDLIHFFHRTSVSRKWTGQIAEERSEDGESRRERSFHFRWRWETRDCGVLYRFVYNIECVCVNCRCIEFVDAFGVGCKCLGVLGVCRSMVFVRRKCMAECTKSMMLIFFYV